MGPLLPAPSRQTRPSGISKKSPKALGLRRNPEASSDAEPAHLLVIRAQHLAGLRVHQMRLSASKARHLEVAEGVLIGIISSPSLDLLTCIRATVQERGHVLSVLR